MSRFSSYFVQLAADVFQRFSSVSQASLVTRFSRTECLSSHSFMSRQSVLAFLLVFLTTFAGVGNVWGADTWELSDIDDLTSSDVFVIAYLKSSVYYAMGNNNGTTSAPSATSITVTKNAITSNVSDAMQWNISGNSTDGYVFYPNGSTTTWLYCTAANNGTRVGTNANKLFTLGVDNGETYLYLKNTATSRYVGQYNDSDFRCYTTAANHTNIGSQHVYFFKKVTSGPQQPANYYIPKFTVSIPSGTIGVRCSQHSLRQHTLSHVNALSY